MTSDRKEMMCTFLERNALTFSSTLYPKVTVPRRMKLHQENRNGSRRTYYDFTDVVRVRNVEYGIEFFFLLSETKDVGINKIF